MKKNQESLIRSIEVLSAKVDESLSLSTRLQRHFSGPFRSAMRREATSYERIRSLRASQPSSRFHYRNLEASLEDLAWDSYMRPTISRQKAND